MGFDTLENFCKRLDLTSAQIMSAVEAEGIPHKRIGAQTLIIAEGEGLVSALHTQEWIKAGGRNPEAVIRTAREKMQKAKRELEGSGPVEV